MMSRERLCAAVPLCIAAMAMCASAVGGPRDMVAFNKAGASFPSRDLSVYDVRLHRFDPQNIANGFCREVAQARMLYIGQYSQGAAGKAIFADAKRVAAVEALLKAGGVVWFDYNGGNDTHIRKFLATFGLDPGRVGGKSFACAVAAKTACPLVRQPHKVRGNAGEAFGWREGWSGNFEAVVCKAGDPKRAAMLVATKVAGKGTVVLSRMYSIFRDSGQKDAASKNIFENAIAYAFGPLPGPGETVAVFDPYKRRSPGVNRFYLNRAARVRWHVDGADVRIPLVVGEPIGLARRPAVVEVTVDLPEGARADSVVATTAWGKRLPCQVRAAGGQRVECVLEADLAPHETRLLFLYAGANPVPRLAPAEGFMLRDEAQGYLLRNDKLRVVLRKDSPSIAAITYTGSDTPNQLATWGDIDQGRANWLRFDKTGGFKSEVVEDGPVCKRVRYASPDYAFTYTLYAHSNVLFFSVASDTKATVERDSGWAPGGEAVNDTLYYESSSGIKKLRLRSDTFYRPFGRIEKFMKEGWLAIEDAGGDVVGEFVAPDRLKRVNVYYHMIYGNTLSVTSSLKPDPTRGALVAARGDHTVVRNAYIAWKNPPEVVVGRVHRRSNVALAVPRLGEQFLTMLGDTHWFNQTVAVADLPTRASRLLTEVERLGGNFIITSDRVPKFLAALIPDAHRRGIGVCVKPHLAGKQRRPCPVARRDVYVDAVKRAARFDIDGMYLLDEYEFPGTCEACRAAFRRKFGMDMPAKMDFAKLAQPPYYDFILFKMDVISSLVHDMVQAGKARRPNILYFHVTSPNNHFRLIGYHDLEKQSADLTTTCSDLYSTDLDFLKYMTKYIRGAQGNDRAVLTVNGCLYDPRETTVNAKLHLFCGSNALWHFSLSYMRTHRGVTEANARVFRWLQYTGLGDVLARCRPAKYLAVLRDRDAFLDSLRRGESTGNLTDYQRRVRDLCLMRNVPTDILFTKYLTQEELARYRVLIVPSDRVLSTARAKLIAGYVDAGGRAIIEGEALRNGVLAKLCGVAPGGDLMEATHIVGEAAPLAGVDAEIASKMLPVQPAGGRALAVADGKPAVLIAAAGKGKVVAVALTQLPVDMEKRLVLAIAPRRPVVPPPQLEEKIETNVLTDGKRSVVVAYNPDYAKRRAGVLDTSALAGREELDFERGVQTRYDGKVPIDLGPGRFAFVMISPVGNATVRTAPAAAMAGAAYSRKPGMKFLRIKASQEGQVQERKKEAGKIYVGIFKTQQTPKSGLDMGAEAMMAVLRAQPGVVAEFIADDSPKTLAFYDVVVLPNMKRRAPNLSKQWQQHVRAYVENGGGVLLVHHTTGFASTTPPVFPGIATAHDYVPITTMKVVAEHPVTNGESIRKRFPHKAKDPAFAQYFKATQFAVGQEFQCGFADYIQLKPGPAGKTVVRSVVRGNRGGDPVVVVGRVGRGKVVLSGMNIGCRSTKEGRKYSFSEQTTPGEAAILVNSVYWLAE